MRFTNAFPSAHGVGVIIGQTSLTLAANDRVGWRRSVSELQVLDLGERIFDDAGHCIPSVLENAMETLRDELSHLKPNYVQVAIADPVVSHYVSSHDKRISIADANALARWHMGKFRSGVPAENYSIESQTGRSQNGEWWQNTSALEYPLLSIVENELESVPLTIIDSVASYVWNRIDPKIRSRRGALIRISQEYWTIQVWEGGALPHVTRSFWRSDDEGQELLARELASTLRLSTTLSPLSVHVYESASNNPPVLQALESLLDKEFTLRVYQTGFPRRENVLFADSAARDVSWPR